MCCSFCRKDRNSVNQMIAGPEFNGEVIYICDECVDITYSIFHQSQHDPVPESNGRKLIPSDIKSYLDEYIIGQDEAKSIISVALYNHFKRINNRSDIVLDKSNIIMIGPSGSGKSLLIKTIAKLFDLPYVLADATTLTQAGYVGQDVQNLIEMLLDRADGDVKRAQKGIIFIDEIDKISKKTESSTVSRDVAGEGVQQALLQLVEGSLVRITNNSSRSSEQIDFDTNGVLFIVSGAFVGMENIIKKNRQTTSIGINADITDTIKDKQLLKTVGAEDLIQYGLIPEFVGRFPVVTTLDELDVAALRQILEYPKNNVTSQFQELFRMDGVTLLFEPEFLSYVARESFTKKTGARGLRAIIERTLLKTQFVLPNLVKEGHDCVVVDKDGEVQMSRTKKSVVSKFKRKGKQNDSKA